VQRILFLIGDRIVKWLERRRWFGAFRFRLTRRIQSVMSCVSYWPVTRNARLDFIFDYLPPLQMNFFKGLPVLDIGCVDSLLVYEIADRNYASFGLDVRDYQVKLPEHIGFLKCDIAEPLPKEMETMQFEYIIATSVIELLGVGKYPGKKKEHADRAALENIHKLLSPTGVFLMTVPTWNWKFIYGKGYLLGDVYGLVGGLFHVAEVTQRGGHICAALVKIIGGQRNIACINKDWKNV
jgi:SAM-dependent methyltransferase